MHTQSLELASKKSKIEIPSFSDLILFTQNDVFICYLIWNFDGETKCLAFENTSVQFKKKMRNAIHIQWNANYLFLFFFLPRLSSTLLTFIRTVEIPFSFVVYFYACTSQAKPKHNLCLYGTICCLVEKSRQHSI